MDGAAHASTRVHLTLDGFLGRAKPTGRALSDDERGEALSLLLRAGLLRAGLPRRRPSSQHALLVNATTAHDLLALPPPTPSGT